MSLVEDQKLIKKCLKQDALAQRALYEKYRQAWFMCCLRYAKDKMEAEDIFQNGLISIFKDLNQFNRDKAAFGTWSNRVMVNAALQYLRKWSKYDRIMVSEEHGFEATVQEDIFAELGAKELTKMIQNLPIGYRIVFNMYVLEGYKHREIAKELDISVGTSKSQLFKAKRILKRELELIFQNN